MQQETSGNNKKVYAMRKLLLILLLAGCGFRPMFSDNDTDIYVAPIASGVNGIELRNALNTYLGGQKEANAHYTLDVVLTDPRTKYKALEETGISTWQEIALTATYTLRAGDKVIATGKESASESYSFVRYLVAANASYNNAVKNTINVLAQKIGNRAVAETYKYAHTDKK